MAFRAGMCLDAAALAAGTDGAFLRAWMRRERPLGLAVSRWRREGRERMAGRMRTQRLRVSDVRGSGEEVER